MSYAGPFDFSFRKQMIYNDWYLDIQSKQIPNTENIKVDNILTNDVEIS